VAQFTSGFTFSYGTLLLVMQRTLRRWTLSVRLVTEQECRNFFKRLFKLFTFQPSSENLRINFSTPKPLNLYKFPIKMQTSASSGCCVIWSGLVCTSVSSPRQSGMWRGRLRACVRTDGRDFKHMLGWYERYLIVISRDNFPFNMWTLHIWRCGQPYIWRKNRCYILQGKVGTYETRCGGLCMCMFQISWAKFMPRIGKTGWHLTKL